MDRFDAMRVFARILERRSFTRAADDLGLPRSSVTEAVKGLEARLGVQLLQRTTRHVAPTLDGEAYYQRCLRILADLEDAESAFSGALPSGPLHVAVHGTLASHFILPYLPQFLDAYPGIELLLSEGDRFVDLVREGVDCAVRVGALADSDLVARRLGLLEEVTCASPAYLDRRGTPQTVDELQGHWMVGFRSSATGTVLPLELVVKGIVRRMTLPVRVTVSGAESYVAAARAGLGLIQVPRYRLERDLREGRLVEVLTACPPTPASVSALYPRAKQLSPRLRAFMTWLVERFQGAAGGQTPPIR